MIDPPTPLFVAFDFETTGLSAIEDRIVEVGAVKFDASGRVLDEFQRLVNPERPSGAGARAIHGISDAELAQAETARDVLPFFLDFLGDPAQVSLMAHNATFDAGFLGRELARLGQPMPDHLVIDTLAMARKQWPKLPRHGLDFLCRWLEIDSQKAHRALADSHRVRALWLALNAENQAIEGELPLAYPIFDPRSPLPAPQGWGWVHDAILGDRVVRIEYKGGTRGMAPREITPRRFSNRGGVAYLVALCHIDHKEKEFRLDRVQSYAVLERSKG